MSPYRVQVMLVSDSSVDIHFNESEFFRRHLRCSRDYLDVKIASDHVAEEQSYMRKERENGEAKDMKSFRCITNPHTPFLVIGSAK